MRIRVSRHRITRLIVLLGTLALLLVACEGNRTATSDMAKDQTLKMIRSVYEGGITLAAMDPAVASFTAPLVEATSLLFDNLVTLDRNEHIEPWGAKSWTISPDGLTYTFTLRPNQRFSDGTPVKASDYAWSFDRLAHPCIEFDNLRGVNFDHTLLALIKDAKAFNSEGCLNGQPSGARTTLIGDSILPDDGAQTLTILLARPSGFFLNVLSTPIASVIERSVAIGSNSSLDNTWTRHLTDGATGRGGSGMFYLAAAPLGADGVITKLVFKPNPHWWGIQAGRKPHFTEIDFLPGDLDSFTRDASIAYIGGFDRSQSRAIKDQPYFHEQPVFDAFSLLSLGFNWENPPFDDLGARKAFCLAINRDQLNEQVYQDLLVSTWHLMPQEIRGYNPRLHGLDDAPVTGNTSLARQYWQRYLAAHGGQAPTIQINAMGGQTGQRLIKFLIQDWQQTLGVTVISPSGFGQVQSPSYLGDQVSIPLSVVDGLLDSSDPAEAFSPGFTGITGAGLFPSFQGNMPEASALLRQANALSDLSQRLPLYQQAEQMLIDNVAVCPLLQNVDNYALRPWVKGDFVEDARGVFPNDAWITGYIARH